MNLHESNTSLYGVTQGISYGQYSRVDEINQRTVERQFADKPMKPCLDLRSLPTKYALFPLIDRRAPSKEPMHKYLDHSSKSNFCPNISKGPADGFMRNVETETALRNQYFALQHGADQSVYVPSSTSDLYGFEAVGRQEVQPFLTIATQYKFEGRVHPNLASGKIGQDRFNNNTRTQLRNTV
jgi:hypothetical protein